MSEARAQLRVLLQRAAQLRAQSDEIQRKIREVLAQIARLSVRKGLAPGPNEVPGRTPVRDRSGSETYPGDSPR
jgi:hypothetical protein